MSTVEREVYALAQHREAGPAIVAHIGSQTVRLPAAEVSRRLAGTLGALDAWKASASGPELAVYAAFKTAINIGFPFVVGIVARAEGLLPPLPNRPRHSDPIRYLIEYLSEALPVALARGEWTVVVDDAGDVTALHWSEEEEDR